MKFDDIIEVLDHFDIQYWRSGKNVASGWIGLQCPYCGDDSNHLGIRLKDNACTCWKCGHHRLAEVLSTITELRLGEAIKVVKFLGAVDEDFPPYYHQGTPTPHEVKLKGKMSLPPESSSRFPSMHSEYLRSRGFPPLRTIRKFKLRAVENLGRYKFRILIPVYMDRRLVNFTARDVTGIQEPKYLMASNREALIPREQCVFNIDSVTEGGDCILVEGPTDVMKLGDSAVSFFGVQESPAQIVALKNKKIRNLYIMYDNDKSGNKNANRLAKYFAPLFKRVEVVRLTGVEDPGSLSVEDAMSLKYNLRINM
jgi:5S rRNA maturation endonuclease (ribonuclease M5)